MGAPMISAAGYGVAATPWRAVQRAGAGDVASWQAGAVQRTDIVINS
jgi:hypothetical protein